MVQKVAKCDIYRVDPGGAVKALYNPWVGHCNQPELCSLVQRRSVMLGVSFGKIRRFSSELLAILK